MDKFDEEKEALLIISLSYEESKKQNIDLFKYKKEDKILIDFMDKEIEEGSLKDLEIFKRDLNVVATEKGYFMSCYENEVKYL